MDETTDEDNKLVKPGARFQELDALRGMAALMVVLFHFTMGREEANWGFKIGTTGVDLFFIISGFVIFMSLNRVKRGIDFVINRVSRLYPTYWSCVTFSFIMYVAVALLLRHESVPMALYGQYLANMTMFQFYMDIENLEGPYWTMIIEMIFYIVVLLFFQLKILRYFTQAGLATIFLTLIGVCFYDSNDWVKLAVKWIPLLQFTPLFLAGTIFYKIYTKQYRQLWLSYAIVGLCLLSQIALFEYSGRSKAFVSKTEYAAILLAYFIFFTLFINHRLRFIISKGTLFLGKISFSLYLVHEYISLNLIIPFFVKRFENGFWIGATVALTVVILIATFVTYFIEIPYGKYMKDKLRVWFSREPVAFPITK